MSCASFGARCRSVEEFKPLNHIDEGTYGVVWRAEDERTGEVVALKRVKMEKEREGFPLTGVREFNTLLRCNHPNLINVKEVVVGSRDKIYMVMEYVEHDLRNVMDAMRTPFSLPEAKCIMRQLLSGIAYLHDQWVLHRDIKTSNILYSNKGEVKICDFGLARQYGEPLRAYTPVVVTLWYRAPELLLGADHYSTPIDVFSLGCVMAELLQGKTLFNGKGELEQLGQMVDLLGSPTERDWPTRGRKGEPGYVPGILDLPGLTGAGTGARLRHQPHFRLREKFPKHSFHGGPTLSDAGFDLLESMLRWDPLARPTAAEALRHPWFQEAPLAKDPSLMPTFPSKHERRHRAAPSHAPAADFDST